MIPGIDQIGITNIASLERYAKRFAQKYCLASYLDVDDLVQEVLIARWASPNKEVKAKYAIFNALRPTFPMRGKLIKHLEFNDGFMGQVDYTSNLVNYLDITRAMSKIENQDVVTALKLLMAGYDYNEIGQALGCSHQNISYLIKTTLRDSLNPKSVKNQIKAEKQTTTEKVLELSRQGLSQAKIAHEVGCSQTRVWRILKKFNAGQSAMCPRREK